ncbi:MAG: hypothetical protein ACRYG7_15830, partial [Janthinobacterium lividum]
LKKDKPAYFIVDKYHLPILLINHNSKKNNDLSIWGESMKSVKRHVLIPVFVYVIFLLFATFIFYKLFIWILGKLIGVFIVKNYNTIAEKDKANEVRKAINKYFKKRIALRKRKLRK